MSDVTTVTRDHLGETPENWSFSVYNETRQLMVTVRVSKLVAPNIYWAAEEARRLSVPLFERHVP